jgi:hypothetical protein
LILLVQELLAVRNWSELSRARSLGLLDPRFLRPLWIQLVDALVLTLPTYGGVMLAGIVIASRGHRRLFALPAALIVFLPVIGAPHQPLPIGYEWNLICAVSCPGAWFSNPWFGASLDLAVVLAPAFVLSRGIAPHRWPGPGDAAAFTAVGLAIGLAILVDRTALVVTGDNPNVPVFVAASAFGIAAGMRRPWWPWAHILAVAALATAITSLFLIVADPVNPLALSMWGSSVVFTLEDAAPYIICVLVVTCWEPLAHLTRRALGTPIALVVAVNALNLVDAVLTAVAIRSGGAFELNPIVRVGGIPLKLTLVGVLTWLLYRKRPRALLVPAVVLAWVVCYHLSGIIVNR